MPVDNLLYTFVDAEFYESFDRYVPDDRRFLRHVKALLPPSWTCKQNGIWFVCNSPTSLMPLQGWKIHLSAIFEDAPALLTTVARTLIRRDTAFKFALDHLVLYLLASKRWNRGGSGKFITIYPKTPTDFVDLIEELHQACIGFRGQYILSDRRYKDSNVVHYRYGGFAKMSRLTASGDQQMIVVTPEGVAAPDIRNPYFTVPDWEADPFPQDNAAAESNKLKDGRYTVESVLAFSNTGGVYLATDRSTNMRVVIKEARPWTNLSGYGIDAVTLLKKEHRLLKLLEDERIAPRPLDFFRDWEHYFLVQEYLDGVPLRGYSAGRCLPLKTRPTSADVDEFCEVFYSTYPEVARIVKVLHEHDIVFGDLSHNNILILKDSREPRIIDFEGACQIGVDTPTVLFTPGFGSSELLTGATAEKADDCFALGAVILASLSPTSGFYHLQPNAHEGFLRSIFSDFPLPKRIAEVVAALMQPERVQRISAAEAVEGLSHQPREGWPPLLKSAAAKQCEIAIQPILNYLRASETPDRQDRLFPSDPHAFVTNPLSIAYGACGVAYVFQRVCNEVPRSVVEWILAREISTDIYPGGLYTGTSGIAWTLLECGLKDKACELIELTANHPLRFESPDLFWGAAGWGMAQLRFHLEYGEDSFLQNAVAAGRHLIQSAIRSSEGWNWPVDGDVSYGLAHGGSGIALFFLYLHLATLDPEYLEVGRSALAFDIANTSPMEGNGLTLRMKASSRTVVPYWRWGAAGLGTAVVRFLKVVGESEYRDVLDKLIVDADRKYTIFPSRFFGLAGLGDFFLDMAQLDDGRDAEMYIEKARKAAAGILLFQVQRPTGIAFPGEELMRLSCDYGTGSAGILLFLHRLIHGGPSPFMLDALLNCRASPAPAIQADRIVQYA